MSFVFDFHLGGESRQDACWLRVVKSINREDSKLLIVGMKWFCTVVLSADERLRRVSVYNVCILCVQHKKRKVSYVPSEISLRSVNQRAETRGGGAPFERGRGALRKGAGRPSKGAGRTSLSSQSINQTIN